MTNVAFINNGSTVCLLGLRRLMGVALGDAAPLALSSRYSLCPIGSRTQKPSTAAINYSTVMS